MHDITRMNGRAEKKPDLFLTARTCLDVFYNLSSESIYLKEYQKLV